MPSAPTTQPAPGTSSEPSAPPEPGNRPGGTGASEPGTSFDRSGAGSSTTCTQQIEHFRRDMLAVPVAELDDDARLELLHELEVLTRTLGAVTAQTQVAFHTSQVARQIQSGVRPSAAGKGVAHDLAMARMTSPYWGSRELVAAKALVTGMPHTLAALTAGQISAYQARLVAEATSCVSAEDRAEVDTRLAPSLAGASTAEITANARGLVYEIDPAGFVERARKAAADRGVSIRPCPDVMGLLSARLPAPQAIACYRALRDKAVAMRASGDPRTLSQLMADTFYERLTGRAVVDGIDVEVGLVITDSALFAGTSEAAFLDGYGPIPAEMAREFLRPRDGAAPETGHPKSQDDQDEPKVRDESEDRDDEDPEDSDDKAPAGWDDETGHPQDDESEFPEDEPEGGDDESEFPQDEPEHRDDDDTGLPHDTEPEGQEDLEPASPAGEAPQFCPDGITCTRSSCPLIHGDPEAVRPEPAQTAPQAPAPTPAPPATAGVKAATVWLRRLFTDPVTGVLTRRDTRARRFTGPLRGFLLARDRTCRNPWCGAPIRHVDHIQRHADGGETVEENGRGLCARCNLEREHPRHLDRPDTSYRPPPPLLPTFLVVPTTHGP